MKGMWRQRAVESQYRRRRHQVPPAARRARRGCPRCFPACGASEMRDVGQTLQHVIVDTDRFGETAAAVHDAVTDGCDTAPLALRSTRRSWPRLLSGGRVVRRDDLFVCVVSAQLDRGVRRTSRSASPSTERTPLTGSSKASLTETTAVERENTFVRHRRLSPRWRGGSGSSRAPRACPQDFPRRTAHGRQSSVAPGLQVAGPDGVRWHVVRARSIHEVVSRHPD